MLQSETVQLRFDTPVRQLSDVRVKNLVLTAVNVDLGTVGKAEGKPMGANGQPPK
jgi:hypothetical protein